METAVIIILVIITGACFVRLYFYKKEIKSLTSKIKFIYEEETNSILTVNYSDKGLLEFVRQINNLIEKYRKLQIAAENSSKMIKNDFTNLSHDIRTPLTAITGYFQLLCDSSDKDEKQKYINIINERIKSLESILESIFTYSKLQNENYVMKMENIDINKIITNVTLSFYDDIVRKNITPHIDFPDSPVWIYGYYEAFNRIIQNILINAMRHGEKNLELGLKNDVKKVYFYCKNDVKDIEEIDIDRVFEQFYKADINRTRTSSGLGLSITKKLCDKMNVSVKAYISDESYFVIEIYFTN